MNNVNVNVPQIYQPVNRQPADKYNLARSKGEYAPKWTQNSLKAQSRRDERVEAQREQSEDWLLWA